MPIHRRRASHAEAEPGESTFAAINAANWIPPHPGDHGAMHRTRYNPRQQMIPSRRVLALMLAVICAAAAACHAQATASWEQPAADLAKQISAIAGPGPATLTMRNQSSLSAEELPAIQRLLERDLRGYGILISGTESATNIRVALSENTTGGLWIAEVQEGTEVRVAMVPVALNARVESATGSEIMLRKTLVWQQNHPVLDAMIVPSGATRRILLLDPDRIVSYVTTGGNWIKEQEFLIPHSRPFPRDMRGRLLAGQGHLFDAYLPSVLCTGTDSAGSLMVSCADSDDPWPLTSPVEAPNLAQQKAFYNATRNYFTGVLSPGFGMQLQPFYSSAVLPRPNGAAMLFNGIDGRILLIENNVMKPIAGARDWGSDLASIRSGCGSGAQVLVSGSGAAPTDSVRAYDIPGREAAPVSSALAFDGQVMAIWPSNDGTAATVIVRTATGHMPYEVYSVSAFCN